MLCIRFCFISLFFPYGLLFSVCKFENYGQLFAKLVTFPLSTSMPFCSKYDFFLALSIKRKNLLFLLLLNLNCPYTLLCPFKCTEETFPSLASRVLACFNWLLECCPAKVINLNLLSLLEDERPSGPEMSQPSFPSWSPRDMGQWQGRYLCYICFWSIFLIDFPVSEPNVPPVLEIPGVSDNEVFLGLWNNNIIASGPPLLLATVSEVSSSQITSFLFSTCYFCDVLSPALFVLVSNAFYFLTAKFSGVWKESIDIPELSRSLFTQFYRWENSGRSS